MTASELPAFTLSAADYITTAKRNRLVRLAVSSILLTKGGSLRALAEIGRQVGCSTRTVASAKIELQAMGLLGSILAVAPVARRAPEASFANLTYRLNDLLCWFDGVEGDALSDVTIREARVETQKLLRIIKRKGSLPRDFGSVSLRLEELEKLYQFPEYDLALIAA